MTPDHLLVAERFGPTIQGEGRRAGQAAYFLRLAGCNLSCAWCDTPYSWDWSRYDHEAEVHPTPLPEVAAWASTFTPGTRLVITGGEPLLQAKALDALAPLLPRRLAVDIETNGTRPIPATLRKRLATVTASPKIGPSAQQNLLAATVHPSLVEDTGVDLKFVVADDADLAAALVWLDGHPTVAARRVWFMPEGATAAAVAERTPALAATASALGYNFTSRLHVLAWGSSRGH